jgi:sugar lactone lactonase YvrE
LEKPIKITNDLDVDGDDIYFIDTSYFRDLTDIFLEVVEMSPRGRLFHFNEKTNELRVLLEDIYLPNGIQLMPDKESLLISEMTLNRIIKWGF